MASSSGRCSVGVDRLAALSATQAAAAGNGGPLVAAFAGAGLSGEHRRVASWHPLGAQDLQAVGELVQRNWSLESRWHVGDIAWNLCQWSERSNAPAAVWEGSDGSAASAAWVDYPSALNLVVDRQRPELVEDVVSWFEDVATERPLEVTVLEHQMDLIGELERRGYERADGPFFVHLRRDLVEVPAPQDREGFRVRAIEPADIPARVRVHRAAWEPSKVTEESYRRLTRCWQYRSSSTGSSRPKGCSSRSASPGWTTSTASASSSPSA
jgi:hypothetical protein